MAGNVKNLTNMGKGRPKGAKNRTTLNIKEAITYAFNRLGGEKALYDWAMKNEENKRIFYSQIFLKLIPKDVNLGVTYPNIEEILLNGRALQSRLIQESSTQNKTFLISNQGVISND